jgi:hypothetical protein
VDSHGIGVVIRAVSGSATRDATIADAPPQAPRRSERPDERPMGGDAPMWPAAALGGRPRRAPKREIVEAILYLLRAGCSWRLLPHDFPRDRRFTPTCAAGNGKGSGREFITRWSWPTGSAPDAKLRRPPPSPTARPSGRRIKRGLKGHGEGRPWPRRGRVSAPNGKKIRWRRRVRRLARTGGARRLTLTDADGRLLAVEVHAADI